MENSQSTGVLDHAVKTTPTTTTIKVKNPSFISKYVSLRNKLDKLGMEKKELEAEIVEWGEKQIKAGVTTNMTLPLSGALGKKVNLSLYHAKVTEKQALQYDEELRKLSEYLEDDYANSVQRNADKIVELTTQIESLQEEIYSLSYSDKEALEAYQLMLNKVMKTMPKSLGVRLKHL